MKTAAAAATGKTKEADFITAAVYLITSCRCVACRNGVGFGQHTAPDSVQRKLITASPAPCRTAAVVLAALPSP